jgi:hypothetical protein
MKIVLVLCAVSLAGCALSPVRGSGAVAPASTAGTQRIETSAGAFLVRPAVAEDFRRLLAGEPTHRQYFAW